MGRNAQARQAAPSQAFNVVAVSVNPHEPLAALTAWRNRYARPDWTVAQDGRGALSSTVRLQHLDTKFLLDADSKILDNDLPHAPTRLLQAILAGLTATTGFLSVLAVVGVPVALGAGQLANTIPWVGFALVALWQWTLRPEDASGRERGVVEQAPSRTDASTIAGD